MVIIHPGEYFSKERFDLDYYQTQLRNLENSQINTAIGKCGKKHNTRKGQRKRRIRSEKNVDCQVKKKVKK